MKEPLAAFKAACLFSPSKVHEMQPNSAMVDSLVAFLFLTDSVAALKGELPQPLVAAAEDVSPTYDPLKFWKEHQDTWSTCTVGCCCSTSAARAAFISGFRACIFTAYHYSFGECTAKLPPGLHRSISDAVQYNKH